MYQQSHHGSSQHSLVLLVAGRGWTDQPSDRIMLGFSFASDFWVQLLSSNSNTSLLHLVVYIRDTLGSVTEYNLSSIVVGPHRALVDRLENFTRGINDSFLLSRLNSGNQNMLSQLITSVSHQLNQLTDQMVDTLIASRYRKELAFFVTFHRYCSDGLHAIDLIVTPLTEKNLSRISRSF